MRFENVEVRMTLHAHEQYCERVEPIGLDELEELCRTQLQERDFEYCKGEFIHLSGVWWVYSIIENVMSMITCYGKTNMDIPRALAWAFHHQDRIDLKEMI